MNVFAKLISVSNPNKFTYFEGFERDGELIFDSTNPKDAINLNNNYWSFETLVERCKFISSIYNPKAYKVVFFTNKYYYKVGEFYIKSYTIGNPKKIEFTTDSAEALTCQDLENVKDDIKKSFSNMKVEVHEIPITIEEIDAKC